VSRKLIDEKLMKIRTFSETKRTPRKLKDFASWKASEFYNWTLLYARYCLNEGVLNGMCYHHFLTFVEAMDILHKDVVSDLEVKRAETLLKEFVQKFESIYGKNQMTVNVHLLLHLCNNVKMFGPLHNYSLFVFESFNGVINKYITGPNEPLMQIVTRQFAFFDAKNESTNCMTAADNFCKSVMHKEGTRQKNSNVSRRFSTILYGDALYRSYSTYFINNMIICTVDQCKNIKYNDSTIFYNDCFYEITAILVDSNDNLFLKVRRIETKTYDQFYNYFEITKYQNLEILKIETKFKKCLVYEKENEPNAISIINNILIVN
jgi:hypothetical protein